MAGAPDRLETKYEQIRRFLSVGKIPSTYNKSERFNFKKYCAKFTLKDGEIYCGQRQVVKSEEEALTHFREVHMLPIGGHSGFNKTCSALSRRWFWHAMTQDVRKWIKECDKCQKVGRPLTAPQKLQCIKVSAVWELVGIDLAGPYPTTKDGYQYIFTATDYFSKWVEAFPLKTKTAVEVSEQMCNLIYQHGCPKRILSDQGREFVNQLNEHICNILGIKRSVTAAFHPQTNGLDEETNHNIKRALTKLVNDQQNNWDTYLKPTLYSLRSKVQRTTNFSPFLLMYGREAVFSSQVPLELPLTIILPEKETYERFVEEKKASSELLHKKTMENIEKAQGRQKDAHASGKAEQTSVEDENLPEFSTSESYTESNIAWSEESAQDRSVPNPTLLQRTSVSHNLLTQFQSRLTEENKLNEVRPSQIEDTEGRMLNLSWCQCSNCTLMTSAEESICCEEIKQVKDFRGEHSCICAHPDLQLFVVNERFLRQHIGMADLVSPSEMQQNPNVHLRWAGYRSFTTLIYGRLDKGHRVPLPSCVGKLIRDTFPAADGVYTGFQWLSTYTGMQTPFGQSF